MDALFTFFAIMLALIMKLIYNDTKVINTKDLFIELFI